MLNDKISQISNLEIKRKKRRISLVYRKTGSGVRFFCTKLYNKKCLQYCISEHKIFS